MKDIENIIVHSLFATPIYQRALRKSLDKKLIKKFESFKIDTHKNEGNRTTNNNFILNLPVFKNVKKEVEFHINEYMKHILRIEDKVKVHLTQSWLNYSRKKEFHHKHAHPNSYISGVLYIKANKLYDNIRFYRHKFGAPYCYNFDLRNYKEYNVWNSDNWTIPVDASTIVIFPSGTEHSVIQKKEDNLRISLAFNTVLTGEVGSKEELTYAKL